MKKNWHLPPIKESNVPFENRYPHQVGFLLMDICNLSCSHCFLSTIDDNGVPRLNGEFASGFMEIDKFHKIVDRLEDVLINSKRVSLTSVEALFHPNIWEMFHHIREINNDITFVVGSNGLLLNEKNILKLKEIGNIDLGISLDGHKKETVEKFKTGVNFDRVIRNLKLLKQHNVEYRTTFVSHKNNIEELVDYVDFVRDLGASSIKVNTLCPYDIQLSDKTLVSKGKTELEEIERVYVVAKKRANKLGIDLFYRRTYIEPLGCGYASYEMFIDMDGNVVPCNHFIRPDTFALFGKVIEPKQIRYGNVLDEDPIKIWKKSNCVSFRKTLHDRKLPTECSGCPQGLLGVT